jgi:hypothetical protein
MQLLQCARVERIALVRDLPGLGQVQSERVELDARELIAGVDASPFLGRGRPTDKEQIDAFRCLIQRLLEQGVQRIGRV